MQLCPCGSNIFYAACCGPFLSHHQIPSTPEALMRSRYTAYFMGNIDYIVETMKSPASDRFDPISARERANKIKWLELNVVNASHDKNTGTVEFYASYADGQKTRVLHEISRFILEQGKWFYVSGTYPDDL